MSAQQIKANRLELIQALRALAALTVVLGHALHETFSFPGHNSGALGTFVMERSGAGVDLFFAISGFVMIYASRNLFATPNAAGTFLFRRVARIVPLYWAVTSIFLLVLAASPHLLSTGAPTPGEIIKSYFFIPYFALETALAQPIYKLGWTLNYEMFFYVLLACAIALPRRRAVLALTVSLSVLAIAGAFVRTGNEPWAFWTHPIIIEFGAGAILGSLYIDDVRLPKGVAWALIGVAVFVFVMAPLPAAGTIYDSYRPLFWGIPAVLVLASATLCGPVALHGTITHTAVLLGDASYSIYLLHPMVIRALRIFWEKMALSSTLPGWMFVLTVVIATIVISLVAYRWFERPLTNWLQKWGDRSAAPTVSRAS